MVISWLSNNLTIKLGTDVKKNFWELTQSLENYFRVMKDGILHLQYAKPVYKLKIK